MRSNEGALAFAAYYERALDWSLATSDPFLLRQISAPTCDACTRYINSLENLRRGNGHVIGGRIRVEQVSIAEGKHLVKADIVVAVHISQEPMSVASPSGVPSVVTRTEERPVSYLHMLWVDDHWLVAGDFG